MVKNLTSNFWICIVHKVENKISQLQLSLFRKEKKIIEKSWHRSDHFQHFLGSKWNAKGIWGVNLHGAGLNLTPYFMIWSIIVCTYIQYLGRNKIKIREWKKVFKIKLRKLVLPRPCGRGQPLRPLFKLSDACGRDEEFPWTRAPRAPPACPAQLFRERSADFRLHQVGSWRSERTHTHFRLDFGSANPAPPPRMRGAQAVPPGQGADPWTPPILGSTIRPFPHTPPF